MRRIAHPFRPPGPFDGGPACHQSRRPYNMAYISWIPFIRERFRIRPRLSAPTSFEASQFLSPSSSDESLPLYPRWMILSIPWPHIRLKPRNIRPLRGLHPLVNLDEIP